MSATPRPWRAKQHESDQWYQWRIYGQPSGALPDWEQLVANVLPGQADPEANARLIVQAVNAHEELLEAAKMLLTLDSEGAIPGQGFRDAMADLNAAIEKAERP